MTRDHLPHLHELAPGLLAGLGYNGRGVAMATVMGRLLVSWPISPLIVVFIIALAMRIAMGSATVAIITTAGIVAPMVKGLPGYSPEMIMLALCCGGTGPSHVNDSGFWLVQSLFNIPTKETLATWSVLETVLSVAGLGFTLLLAMVVR